MKPLLLLPPGGNPPRRRSFRVRRDPQWQAAEKLELAAAQNRSLILLIYRLRSNAADNPIDPDTGLYVARMRFTVLLGDPTPIELAPLELLYNLHGRDAIVVDVRCPAADALAPEVISTNGWVEELKEAFRFFHEIGDHEDEG